MMASFYVALPIAIGIIAVAIAVISFLDGRKRTKLLETMIKTLPYTSRRAKRSSTTNKKTDTRKATNSIRSHDIQRMKLELEREKLQWRKNRDIAKGITWVIEHLNPDYEDDEEND